MVGGRAQILGPPPLALGSLGVLCTPTILRASGERGAQRDQDTSFEVGPSV